MNDIYTELSELYNNKTPLPSSRVIPNPSNITTAKNDYLVGNSYTESSEYINNITTIIKKDDLTNNLIVLTEDENDKIDNTIISKEKPVIINDEIINKKYINNNYFDNYFDNYSKNYALQFYLASITVVGLFIFFRMVQKSK